MMKITDLLIIVLLAFSVAAAQDTFDCTVEPYLVVDVSTGVEDVLKQVIVDKGDLVNQGQVVARLESDVEKAAVEQARARAAMNSALESQQVRLAYAQKRLKRLQEMASHVSREQLDEVQSEKDLAQLGLLQEQENKKLAQLDLRRLEALYARRTIRSPITGVVMERFLTAGEFAKAQPILRLAQIDPLNVEVILPVSRYGEVEVGMSARVQPEEPLTGTYGAVVTVVEKVIDAASGTLAVRLEMPNPDYALPAGLACTVQFAGHESVAVH